VRWPTLKNAPRKRCAFDIQVDTPNVQVSFSDEAAAPVDRPYSREAESVLIKTSPARSAKAAWGV